MSIMQREFITELRKQVSDEERESLARSEGAAHILISESNRATMLRLLNDDSPHDGEVDEETARELHQALASYLREYMADQPSGHKWIILCCLYLSMVAKEPLHPQAVVGWQKVEDAYYCSAREDQEGSLCRWCVCRRLEA